MRLAKYTQEEMFFAWEAFLLRYRPMAHALARSLTGPATDADDLVQEAFLAVLRAHRSNEERFESPAHARNYLLRTVRNLAQHAGRDRVRLLPFEENAVFENSSISAADAQATASVMERQEALASLLHQLGPDELNLLTRRFSNGETLMRIALETGVPVSTLHSRERALPDRLRAELERSERERA